MGSRLFIREGIKAKRIGSSSGSSTYIGTGLDFQKKKDLDNIVKKRKQLQYKLHKITEIIEKINSSSPLSELNAKLKNLYIKTLRNSTILKHKIHKFYRREAELEMAVRKSYFDSRIEASDTLFTGVEIGMGDNLLSVKNDFINCYVKRGKKGSILISSFVEVKKS